MASAVHYVPGASGDGTVFSLHRLVDGAHVASPDCWCHPRNFSYDELIGMNVDEMMQLLREDMN